MIGDELFSEWLEAIAQCESCGTPHQKGTAQTVGFVNKENKYVPASWNIKRSKWDQYRKLCRACRVEGQEPKREGSAPGSNPLARRADENVISYISRAHGVIATAFRQAGAVGKVSVLLKTVEDLNMSIEAKNDGN